MTLILNGTDNSATTPAVTGTDTDTGVYYPAANQVALATSGTLALLVNSAQNVGIGTNNPGAKLTIEGTGNILRLGDGTNSFNVRFQGPNNWSQELNTSTDVFTLQRNSIDFFGVNSAGGAVLKGASNTANGVGIVFPATQAASTDANTLDDYEEGTYTVTLTPGVSGSITLQTGYTSMSYTRVGRVVTITGNPRIQSVSSPTGSILLTLPFPVRNGTSTTSRAGSAIAYYDNSNAPLYFFSIPCAAGETSTTLSIYVSSFSPAAVVPAANDELYVSFTYFTD